MASRGAREEALGIRAALGGRPTRSRGAGPGSHREALLGRGRLELVFGSLLPGSVDPAPGLALALSGLALAVPLNPKYIAQTKFCIMIILPIILIISIPICIIITSI